MPNRVNANDWLYRMVRPAYCRNNELALDAFVDKWEKQSFYLVRASSPRAVLEGFAKYPSARKLCHKSPIDADPTFLEMYDAGYRVVVIPADALNKFGLQIAPEPNGDDYRPDGHVNVIEARQKAAVLASCAYVLNRDEMISGFTPPGP